MGKSGYKKFLKKERAKVKLKGSKAILPKGQNVTDTNFKVKKIVIKDQIKQHEAGEILSKKNHSVKELVSRLRHKNAGMIIDALGGLSEIISTYSEKAFDFTLVEIIQGVCVLTINFNPEVRKEASKLLRFIFSKVPAVRLSASFPSVFSYLKCALTHIDSGVRGDGLNLFDTLLEYVPSECAQHSSDLLPVCLDLVSETSSGARALSLNLDSKLTADKWRGKVLARIRMLLSTTAHSCGAKRRDNSSERRNIEINCNGVNGLVSIKNYPPCYTNLYRNVYSLGLNKFEESVKNAKLKFDIKEFCSSLIPVLVDAFIEVVPVDNDKPKIESSSGRTVDISAVALLQCIADIILSLWTIIVDESEDKSNESWMQEKFKDLLMNRLVSSNFPYSTHTVSDLKGKKKKMSDMMLSVLKMEFSEPECYTVNILLAEIVVLFVGKMHWKPIISYIKNCFRVPEKLGEVESKMLAACVFKIFQKSDGADTRSLLSATANICKTSNCPLTHHLFKTLVKIASDQSFSHFHCDKSYEQWLSSLPETLTKHSITLDNLESILSIAKKKYPSFSQSLDGFIEAILDNIPNIEVRGMDKSEAELNISNLLYWVEDWDGELLDNLKKGIQNNYWGSRISQHIKEIVTTKIIYCENAILSQLVDDWWMNNNLTAGNLSAENCVT